MPDSPTQSPAQTDSPRTSEPEHDSVGLENPAIEDSVIVSEHSKDPEILPTEDYVLNFIGGEQSIRKSRLMYSDLESRQTQEPRSFFVYCDFG